LPTFSNIKQLELYVNKMAKEAMLKGNSVKNTVISTGKKHVQEDVYDVYSPKVYQRTGELKENWKVEEISDGIAVFNDRREGEKDIVETIEYGKNYDFDFEYSNTPRPFIENTRQELSKGNKLANSLKQDLKSIGLDVE
jgi:hypothetical protein